MTSKIILLFGILVCFTASIEAGERSNVLLVSLGTGPQPKSDQKNSQLAIDYTFYEFERSPRSGISLGFSLAHIWTDTETNEKINAFTFYPQLTLRPVKESFRNTYFFVRALGPTYLSDKQLGHRQQKRFSFQAQVGIGYRIRLTDDETLLLQLSWKHFSNANLFGDNESIDIPFMLTFGLDL